MTAIRMLRTLPGTLVGRPGETLEQGSVPVIAEEIAETFIRHGWAEPVTSPMVVPTQVSVGETSIVEPPPVLDPPVLDPPADPPRSRRR